MSKYYAFIAGLPELQLDFENASLPLSMQDFKTKLREVLVSSDWKLMASFYQQYDNENLLSILLEKEGEFNELGNLSKDELLELLVLMREEENLEDQRLPPYYMPFVQSFYETEKTMSPVYWEDLLNRYYFEYYIDSPNQIIHKWFEFNLNLTNFLTALVGRNFSVDPETTLVGENEIVEALKNSQQKDFGLTGLLDFLNSSPYLLEIEGQLEREKLVDKIKWEWIEEETVFHYFDFERIYGYLLQLEICSRWDRLLDPIEESGFQQLAEELMQNVVSDKL